MREGTPDTDLGKVVGRNKTRMGEGGEVLERKAVDHRALRETRIVNDILRCLKTKISELGEIR